MTASPDLRETVSAAILKVMREDGQFGTLAFADAAIAAMQPTLDRAINAERQRNAALESLKVARDALNKVANQFEFYAENHRRKNTKDGDQKAEVNGDLGCEMRQALAQIDAVEGEGR